MDSYNFWQDLFDTYQSLSNWMKFAWLVVPPAFLLGLVALCMWYRIAAKRAGKGIHGDLAYTIHRDDFGQLHVHRHGQRLEQQPTLLLLESPGGDASERQGQNGRT